MKYWKGNPGTEKEGKYGTREDSGAVPDTTEVLKEEYDAWVATFSPDIKPDYKALYTAAVSDAQRLNVIAQRLKLL